MHLPKRVSKSMSLGYSHRLAVSKRSSRMETRSCSHISDFGTREGPSKHQNTPDLDTEPSVGFSGRLQEQLTCWSLTVMYRLGTLQSLLDDACFKAPKEGLIHGGPRNTENLPQTSHMCTRYYALPHLLLHRAQMVLICDQTAFKAAKAEVQDARRSGAIWSYAGARVQKQRNSEHGQP